MPARLSQSSAPSADIRNPRDVGGLRRTPAHLRSGNQRVSINEATMCSSFARNPAAWDAPLVDGHTETCHRQTGARSSTWSVRDDGNVRGPAGYGSGVTAETVSNLCQQGKLGKAVEGLEALAHGGCHISKSLVYAVLKRCVAEKDLLSGRRVHAVTVKKGYGSDTFLCNHIVRMYTAHGQLQEAMDVFTVVARPDAFMWSSVISAHVKHGKDERAIRLYHGMCRSGVKPDGHVFVAALQACARGTDLKSGQQVHANVLASGVEPNLFVCNSLVDMYVKCGSLEEARRVFDGVGKKDVVTWTTMMQGYSQHGMGAEALRLYAVMQEEGTEAPNSMTFVCLLQACASVGAPALAMGKQLHAQIREKGYEADGFLASSLVDMYAKCGSLEDARTVFEGLGQRNVVMWTAMIAGYSRQGMGQEALNVYRAMQEEGIVAPNTVTFLCLLQACASVGPPALESGKHLHAQIKERGLQGDVCMASTVVDMYAKCGSLEDARSVFDKIGQKNVVTWSAMIAGYSQQGQGQEALDLFRAMQEEGFVAPNYVTFVCLLQACASVGTSALEKGKQLHVQIRERGLQGDAFVANTLVHMYAKCGSLEDAHSLFDQLDEKDVVTWNAMLAAYSHRGLGHEALSLYSDMQQEGLAAPDSLTFVCLLQACGSVGIVALEMGKKLHEQIRDRGLQSEVFVANGLVDMYAKCGSLEDALRVFDGLGQKDVVAWTALISGFSQQGMGQEALRLYNAMQEEGISVRNPVTFVCLLHACANVAALHTGRQLHAQIEEQGLQSEVLVAGSLINMYGKSGSMVDAQNVFDGMTERDVATWRALIAGYTCQGDSDVVFDLLHRMREDGIQPDGITFLNVLKASSHVGLLTKGCKFFEAMSKHYDVTPTVEHYTCMVDLLGRAGQLDEALCLVRTMPVLPSSIIWLTLLGACQKWSNLEIGGHAFHEAVKLDEKDAALYVLMANIYTSAGMWEQAQGMHSKRKGIRAWKQPGQSWWTGMDGLVHSFSVGKRRTPRESNSETSSLKQGKGYMTLDGQQKLPTDRKFSPHIGAFLNIYRQIDNREISQ